MPFQLEGRGLDQTIFQSLFLFQESTLASFASQKMHLWRETSRAASRLMLKAPVAQQQLRRGGRQRFNSASPGTRIQLLTNGWCSIFRQLPTWWAFALTPSAWCLKPTCSLLKNKASLWFALREYRVAGCQVPQLVYRKCAQQQGYVASLWNGENREDGLLLPVAWKVSQ